MTIAVPKWLIGVVGLVVIALGAFLIGRSSRGDDVPDTGASVDSIGQASTEGEAPAQPPCGKGHLSGLIDHGELAEAVLGLGRVPAGSRVTDVYTERRVGCEDLNRDGVDEMVLRLDCCPDASPTPWAILAQEAGGWEPLLIRTQQASARLRITDRGVREVTPSYADGDPICCPSGRRSGLVRWTADGYSYEPTGGLDGRSVVFSEDAAVGLGGLDLQTASLADGTEEFGAPSRYSRDGQLCRAYWSDIGVVINFVDLGGRNPCGPDGNVGSAVITGAEAMQVGWRLSDSGLSVGAGEEDLRRAYPEMKPSELPLTTEQGGSGRSFVLVIRPPRYGGELTPTLSARLDSGRVVAYDVSVGVGR